LSAIATLLAAIGLYSLLAHEVLRRQHEIGIRMALGAGRGSILALVGRRSLRLALLGTSVGFLATWWLLRFLEGFLYEVEPYDLSILAAAFGTMVFIVLAASLVPMLRASRSDPAAVLREAS
jgi:ABC-type antimicrobial peptide transport system permease subunit